MKLRRGDGHWTGNFQKPLFRKLRLYGDGNEDDVRYGELVMTMFMMVDEDGADNDGGQSNFLPEKSKRLRGTTRSSSSHPRNYYNDSGGEVEKGRQKGCVKTQKYQSNSCQPRKYYYAGGGD